MPILSSNRPEMAEEEICLFHGGIATGDDYLHRLADRAKTALNLRQPLPVVRFADGEYAFYAKSLTCNGLYQQAESRVAIENAFPFHGEALQTLSQSGFLAPLIYPGNLMPRVSGPLAFLKKLKKRPCVRTFLAFLNKVAAPLSGQNYIPFYVIYAWLSSPSFAEMMDGRKICILNAGSDQEACRRWFGNLRSSPVLTFVDIPPEYVATRWPSMRNPVLKNIPADTELCLVGAGIGALPVCVDVAQALSIPAIDAGHALNMMNDRVDKSNGARLFTQWLPR